MRGSPSAAADTSARKAVGVWLRTVTPCSTSTSRKSSGERVTSRGTTTSLPPCSNAPHISNTETSKAYEWNIDQTSVSSNA